MKIEYTQIVGVESDQNSVKIKFRPQGSSSCAEPVTVQISPHATYLYLNIGHAEFEDGGNTKSLKITATPQ